MTNRSSDRTLGTAIAAVALTVAASLLQAQPMQQMPARIGGHPNLNGVWQAVNTAYWNLEAHSATEWDGFWQLGAVASIPGGQSVIVGGGPIPYLPAALATRDENRAGWPAADPETSCYLPGIPRATYMQFPFQIFQGDGDIIMVYEYASTNREIHIVEPRESQVDTWMGVSNGRWDGETLVVETKGFNGSTWLDRAGNHHTNALIVTERFTLVSPNHIQYEATLDDPLTYSRPWTVSMPLYRRVEPNAQILEFKCVPFAEDFLYHDLLLPEDQ